MKIVIEGEPLSQIRMKYSNRHGFGRVYDPREKQKRAIKEWLKANVKIDKPLDTARISFVFYMPIPKAIPKKKLNFYTSGLLKHLKKPDVDNLVKLYLDCMTGIVYHDDQTISLGSCIKLYGSKPKTIIFVNETTELLTHLDLDYQTASDLYGLESCKRSCDEKLSYSDFCDPSRLPPVLSGGKSSPRYADLPSSGESIFPLDVQQEHPV